MSSYPAKDKLFCSVDGEDIDKADVGLDDSSEVKTTVNDDDLDKQGVPSQEPPVDRDIRAADYHQKPLVMACFRIQMAFDTRRLTKTKTVPKTIPKTQAGTNTKALADL